MPCCQWQDMESARQWLPQPRPPQLLLRASCARRRRARSGSAGLARQGASPGRPGEGAGPLAGGRLRGAAAARGSRCRCIGDSCCSGVGGGGTGGERRRGNVRLWWWWGGLIRQTGPRRAAGPAATSALSSGPQGQDLPGTALTGPAQCLA
jgi:hypothetical protein